MSPGKSIISEIKDNARPEIEALGRERERGNGETEPWAETLDLLQTSKPPFYQNDK